MNRLLKIALFLGFWFSGAAMAAPAGTFFEVTGDVTMTPAPGAPPVKVKTGDLFESGARIVTAADGKTTLKFNDGEVMALYVNTDFTVTNYVYKPEAPAEGNLVVNIARGGLRFVSGLIAKANPSKFAVHTPTVTAGVRGSDGVVILTLTGNGVQVLVGSNGDQVTVTGANGVTVTLTPGNFSYSTGPNASPVTFTAANAPPAVAAVLNQAAALINTNLPPPTPQSAPSAPSAPPPPPTPLQNAQGLVSGAGGGGGGTTSP